MKRRRSVVSSRAALFATALLAGLPAAHALEVAGNLLINLDANDFVNGSSVWSQNTALGAPAISGDFVGVGTPLAETISGGKGVVFDGGAEYFVGPTTTGSALETANPTHSIEVWVYQGNVKAEETLVAWSRRGSDRQNMSYGYGSSTGAGGFGAIGHWGAAADLGWNTVPAAGQWHYLVYTYNGTTQTTNVYVDGALNTSEATGALNPFTGLSINLGIQRSNNSPFDPDQGQILSGAAISKVRIESGELTLAQIQSNYSAELPQFAAPTPQQLPRGPLHRYSFNNAAGAAPAGTVITDSLGGLHGVVKGAGANFTGTGLDLPGGSSASAAYVDLANGLISGKTNLSIEFWATTQTTQNWGRIFDFGTGTAGEINDVGGSANGTNYVFLSGNIGTALDQRLERVGGAIPNGGTARDSIGTTTLGIEHQYVVTYDDTLKQWRWFRDGVVMDTLPDTAGPTTVQDVNNWIGRSQWTADSNWDGLMNEFRIYNYTLSQSQILGDIAAGPDTLNVSAAILAWQPTAGGSYGFNSSAPNDNWGAGPGVFPNAINATATIGNNITGDQTIALNTGVVLGALAVGDLDGTNKFTLTSGTGGTLTMQVTTGRAGITQASTSAGDTIAAPIILNSDTDLTNFSANPLTISASLSGAGELSKGGVGPVNLTGDNSGYGGHIVVAAGQLRIGGGGTTGVLGASPITVTGNGRLVFNRSDAVTISSSIDGTGQLGQEGTGTVTFTGSAAHTGITDLNNGTFILQGTLFGTSSLQVDNTMVIDSGAFANVNGYLSIGTTVGGRMTIKNGASFSVMGDFNVGDVGAGPSQLTIEGGAINGNTLYVGKNPGTSGAVVQTGGDFSANNTGGDWRIGGAFAGGDGVYGSWRITGGTFTVNKNFQIGAFGVGVMEINGGSVTVTGGFPVVGRFQNGAAESYGLLDIKAGSFTNTNFNTKLIAGEEGNGVINVRGTGTLTAAGGIWIGQSNSGGPGNGTLNLLTGGTVTSTLITKGNAAGTGVLNLDGGVLRASMSTPNFLELLDAAYIRAGGATIDTNGSDVTVAQPLLAPTGSGVVTIPVLSGGSGYLGAPFIEIVGGGGHGATAVANMTGGTITGITITNPGVDYTSAPSINIKAGLAGSGFAVDSAGIQIAVNSGGGLTKVGNGVLTLTGASTYTGPTVINQGTLSVGVTGSLGPSVLTTVNIGGTLNGSGFLGPVKLLGGTLSAGDGLGIGLLSTGNLELAGGTFQVDINGAATPGLDYDQVDVFGGVSITQPTELGMGLNYAAGNGDTFTILLNNGGSPNTLSSLFTFGGQPIANNVPFGAFSNASGSHAFVLNYAGGDGNDVVLSVVPEPGSALLVLGGIGAVAVRRRRRSRA